MLKFLTIPLVAIFFILLCAVGGGSIWLFLNGNSIVADETQQSVQASYEDYTPSDAAKSAISDWIQVIRTHRTWNGMLLRAYLLEIILDDQISEQEVEFMHLFLERIEADDFNADKVKPTLKALEEELSLTLVLIGPDSAVTEEVDETGE